MLYVLMLLQIYNDSGKFQSFSPNFSSMSCDKTVNLRQKADMAPKSVATRSHRLTTKKCGSH